MAALRTPSGSVCQKRRQCACTLTLTLTFFTFVLSQATMVEPIRWPSSLSTSWLLVAMGGAMVRCSYRDPPPTATAFATALAVAVAHTLRLPIPTPTPLPGALLVDGSLLDLLESELGLALHQDLSPLHSEPGLPVPDAAQPKGAHAQADSAHADAPAAETRQGGAAADEVRRERAGEARVGKARRSAQLLDAFGVDSITQLTVPQLKTELRARQLSVSGAKADLLRRLLDAL